MYRQFLGWCLMIGSFIFLFTPNIQAQEDTTTIGNEVLKEVRIYGIPIEKYATGSKVQTLDSAMLGTSNATTLARVLQQQSPIYIKAYGNEMLATASFRGTGAGHTAVLWNGLNINSLTAGQTDFTLVPMITIDQVSIQPGSASALYGSDAIGGSIHLQNAPRWQRGLQAGIQQNIGSFGQYFTAGNVNWGNGKLESRTQAYRYSTDNDFTVRISPTENAEQQNASVFNYGIQQAFNYRIANNQYISVQGWHHFSDKQTQSTRGDRFSNDLLQERNTRVVADYVLNNSLGFFNVKLGYINDYLLFNQNSTTATQRGIAALKYEKQLHKNLSLQLGTQWIHIRTNVDAYDGEITEDRTSVYGSLRWQIIPRWQMSLNVRQAFVTDFLAPFAPSLGTEFTLYQNKGNKLLIKALASKNYRIPTLNDRFWQGTGGVGNPNLRAETGWSAEGGLAYENKTQNTTWKAEATYYQMKITDWILWKPIGNVWSPVNVAQVNGSGIEANLQIKIKQSRGYVSLGANYAYTLSTIMQDDNPDFIGKQLLYVPFHSSNAFAFWQFDRWFLQADVNQTGFRYLENSNANFVQGFALANLGVGKNFKLKHHWWSISVRINNLLDHDYESVNNRAMPGRNYQLSLRYQIKNF